MQCKKCGKVVQEGNRFCTNCGAPMPKVEWGNVNEEKQRSQNLIIKMIIALVIIGILIIAIFIIPMVLKDRATQNKKMENDQSLVTTEEVSTGDTDSMSSQKETTVEKEDTETVVKADIDGVNQQIVEVTGTVGVIDEVWSLELETPQSVYVRNSSGSAQLFPSVSLICLTSSSPNDKYNFSDYSGWRVSANGSLTIADGKICLIVGDLISLSAPDVHTEKAYESKEKIQHQQSSQSDYILPDSSSRYLTAADVAGLSEYELEIARNEIYARHGYIFNDKDLRNYFNSKSWYHPTVSSSDFTSSMLSDIEDKNIKLIKSYE